MAASIGEQLRLAREERGMVRPGETVLKFPPKDRAGR